ncbi:MAG: hypothetical protein IJY66_08525, partial [Clostridia bacterium]|nr:hypothetical protein [Clostridia bacterium]
NSASKSQPAVPHVAPAGAKTLSAFLLCQSFCFSPEVSKKKAGKKLGCVTLRKFFPFFLQKEAQKEPKTPFLEFRLCGGDEGSALDLRAFEKARAKLFMSFI